MKKLLVKYFIVVLSFFFFYNATAKVEVVNINSSGIGKTQKLAIEAALVQAISQVNGLEIASKTKSIISEISNNSELEELNSEYGQKIISNTKGLIKSWNIKAQQGRLCQVHDWDIKFNSTNGSN